MALVGEGLGLARVRPAYQQVAEQLLERILAGSIVVGGRLPSEVDLASAFGVSRSTVREALRALAARDVVHTVRGTTGGTFVSRIQREQVSNYLETSIGLMLGSSDVTVEQLLKARELLEVPAARFAALRHESAVLADLAEAIEWERTARDRGAAFRGHRNFHAIVVRACGNDLIALMSGPVFEVLQAQFLAPDLSPDHATTIDRDHREILAAIASGDPGEAALAMQQHLVRQRSSCRDARG